MGFIIVKKVKIMTTTDMNCMKMLLNKLEYDLDSFIYSILLVLTSYFSCLKVKIPSSKYSAVHRIHK